MGGIFIPRIKLLELSNYRFHYKRKVQKRDLNYAGHLGNDSIVRLLQEARLAIFQQLGFTELDLGDSKTGIIIGDLVINFRSEGFLDEELNIESQIEDVTERSMRIYHRIIKKQDNSMLALAETGLVAYDYSTRAIAKWPERFNTELKKY